MVRRRILVTGTTGWLGSELASLLASDRENEVHGLARRPTNIAGVESIEADISSKDDMERINRDYSGDSSSFDVVVHMAGAAGWCDLNQGIDINVGGTRNIIDATRRPTKKQKYVIASSVAVTGSCSPHHPPKRLPVTNDDGFVGSKWAYGLSKHMMEEVVKFMSGADDEPSTVDFLLVRIGGVVTDPPGPLKHLETALDEEVVIEAATVSQHGPIEKILPEFPLCAIALSDILRCLSIAVCAEHKCGVRTVTAVGPTAFSRDPVANVMESWYGARADGIDLAFHRRPGKEFSPIYDTESAREELGFVPQIDLRKLCL